MLWSFRVSLSIVINIIIIIGEGGCDINDNNNNNNNNENNRYVCIYIDCIIVCRAEGCLCSHRRRAYRSAAHREHYAYVRGISSHASERSCKRRWRRPGYQGTTHSLSLSLSLLLINYHLLLLYAMLGDVRVVSTGSESICASIFTEKLSQILNLWRSKQSAADA